MKTIRTILATFGVTTALYGLFALIMLRLNPAFTGRTIYQLFRETGFVALVIGIGCVLAFVIMTIAIVSFRDDGARKKRESLIDDEDTFLEEETVPEERAAEADESWSPEIKRKQRRALRQTEEQEETLPDLFGDDEPEEQPVPRPYRYSREQAEEQPAYAPNDYRRWPQRAPEQPYEDTGYEDPDVRGDGQTYEEAAYNEREQAPDTHESEQEPETAVSADAKKRCPNCGNRIDADSAFCIYCGTRL